MTENEKIINALEGRVYCLVVETAFQSDPVDYKILKDNLTYEEAEKLLKFDISVFWRICMPYTRGYIAHKNDIKIPLNL